MGAQTFKTLDRLRLEVEQTPAPGTLINLIQNPYGDLGAYGWISPASGTAVETWVGSWTWFAFRPAAPATPGWVTTEPYPVAAGQYVSAKWEQSAASGTAYSRARVEWLNAAGAVISASAQTGYLAASASTEATGGTVQSAGPYLAPTGTVRARLRFDVYSSTGGAHPTTSLYFKRPLLVKGATSAAVTNPPYTTAALAPATYTNVLGPTHTITVERSELNVGTLTATILDASLDPSQGNLIRPGKRVRLQAFYNGAWFDLFGGKVVGGNTKYDLARTDAKRARVTLTATDAVSQLAQIPAPNGVASITDLPWVLEGGGIPWSVNGTTGHKVAAPTIVATNANAKTLDQVAITRDSQLGLAWVDTRGVLQVWDRSTIATTPVATLDESAYSDIDLDWDSERCINVVNVKLLRVNAATGETVEVTYGPFVDQASVDQWGPHSKDFTVHGIADTEAAAAAYAAQILAANATPSVRINSMTLPITQVADFDPFGPKRLFIDLYDPVRVVNTNAAINQAARPTAVKHTITPDKWQVQLDFDAEGGVAVPQQAPPLASAPITATSRSQNVVVTTNASGLATIPFGVTFAQPPVVVAVGGNQEHITVAWPNVTTTGFTVLARTAAGAVIASGPIRVLYHAFPETL